VYFGELAPFFAAAARAPASGGLIVFTVETFDGEGFRLGATMRFARARAYVEGSAAAAGLRELALNDAWARREAKEEAPGLVGVFAASGRAPAAFTPNGPPAARA
jgi:predicted TPR repeat methyltransferase